MIIPFMPDVLAKRDPKPTGARTRKQLLTAAELVPSLQDKIQRIADTRPAALCVVERLVDVILAGDGKRIFGDLYDA